METALNEITLVLFTTFAPAGVIGYLVMASAAIFSRDQEKASRISRYLVIPLVLVISGLIVSATHLGTPANALYVLTGVGRSPLSNEVVAAVVFLTIGGVFWIVSFRDDVSRALRIIWLSTTMVAGLVLVWFIAVAYSVPSVPTWSLPMIPASLWLNALSSGPAVGLFGLLLAGENVNQKLVGTVLIIAVCATCANIIVLLAEWQALTEVVTTTTRAVDLVPAFPLVIAGYGVLEIMSITLCFIAMFRRSQKPADLFFSTTAEDRKKIQRLTVVGAAAVFALAASFAVRFAFYAMHMTLGV